VGLAGDATGLVAVPGRAMTIRWTLGARLVLFARVFVRESVRELWRHKLRSLLTTIGITVGVAAVVVDDRG